MAVNPDYIPRPVQWGGQTFSDPQALARWLIARGASPEVWALRHPGAAQGLGMAMPQQMPATPPAQQTAGAPQLPMLPQPQHPQGPPPQMPGQHPQGPGLPGAGPLGGDASRISAIIQALMAATQQMGSPQPPGHPGMQPLQRHKKRGPRRGPGHKQAIPAGQDRGPYIHPKGDMVLHGPPPAPPLDWRRRGRPF